MFHANKRMVSVFECRTSSSEVTVQRHRFLAVLAVEIDVEKKFGACFWASNSNQCSRISVFIAALQRPDKNNRQS